MAKILKHSVPPGYRRAAPPRRPKLDPFIAIIDQILDADKARIKKQRHTAKRIFERLRDEHGFTGGITIVTDYVREKQRRTFTTSLERGAFHETDGRVARDTVKNIDGPPPVK